MFGNKLYFFSLVAILGAIVASSSLKSLVMEQQLALAAGDSGGSDSGDGSGGGDGGGGSGGGDGGGGSGGGKHHHHHHSHSGGGSGSTNNNFQTTGAATPTASTTKGSGFSFKEILEVSPSLKGVVMTSATNKFVDSIGTMHIVGELRNDGTKTLNVNQMVATIYGLNNQTLGLDRATPTPATLSPGQSASFEFFVGGDQPLDGISDLSQISKVKYHVGL
jgi:hypothetical protein